VALCGVLRWCEAQQRLEFMAEVCVIEIAGVSRHGGDRHAGFTL
jgi:hypothetical protein